MHAFSIKIVKEYQFRMKRKIKKTICTLLAAVLLAAMFLVPASAVTGSGVDILFSKPAGWSGNIKIHLWNAGSYDTNWPGVSMTDEGNGWYRYKNSNLSSCSIVVNDGSGNQTADLQVSGMVTVKDNPVAGAFKIDRNVLLGTLQDMVILNRDHTADL